MIKLPTLSSPFSHACSIRSKTPSTNSHREKKSSVKIPPERGQQFSKKDSDFWSSEVKMGTGDLRKEETEMQSKKDVEKEGWGWGRSHE